MDLKDSIKKIPPSTLLSFGVLQKSPDDKFLCPVCGNGEGEDGTGIDINFIDGFWIGHCFKCNRSFDNLHFLSHHFHLNCQHDFKLILQKSAKLFGIESEDDWKKFNAKSNAQNKKHKPKQTDSPPKDYSQVIRYAEMQVEEWLKENGGKFRGLTLQTLRHGRIGYLPRKYYDEPAAKFKPGEKAFPTRIPLPAVTIPFSNNNFQFRALVKVKNANEKEIRYDAPDGSKKDIFLLEDLKAAKAEDVFFMVEGAFDALSIIQAGFKAVALTGPSVTERMQSQLKPLEVKPSIILMLDDDKKDFADNEVEKLKKLGFKAAKAFLPTVISKKVEGSDLLEKVSIKDANDYLQADESDLKVCLQDILKSAVFEEAKSTAEDETSEKTNKRKTSKDFFPDCPVELYIPYGFKYSQGQLWKTFKTKGHDDEMILPFPVFVEKIRYLRTQDESKTNYDICFKRDGFWDKIYDVPAHRVSDARALSKVFSDNKMPIDSKTAARLSTYFSKMMLDPLNLKKVPETKIFKEAGWYDDHFKTFVYPTDKDGKYYVENSVHLETAFKKAGSRERLKELLLKIIFASPEARLAFGIVQAAPLVKPLKCRNIILHLWGSSEIGKTAIANALISSWGDPKTMQGSWGDTMNYILDRANNYNDLPVYIDDTQKMHKKTRENIDTILYRLEDGKTKGRLKGVQEHFVASDVRKASYVVMSTGEQPLRNSNSQQGVYTRVIDVHVTKEFMDAALAKECHEVTAENYGHFGEEYVESLIGKFDDLKEYRKSLYDKIRFKAARLNGWQGRFKDINTLTKDQVGLIDSHIQAFALGYTGLIAFCRAIFGESIVQGLLNMIDDDIDIFIKNNSISKLSSNAERMLPSIRELQYSNPKNFIFEREGGKPSYQSEDRTTWGIVRLNGGLDIYVAQFKKLVREMGAQSAEEIIEGLHDMGVLNEGNLKEHSRKHAKQIFLKMSDGKDVNTACISIKPAVIERQIE